MRRSVYLIAALTVEFAALCALAAIGDLRAHVTAFVLLFILAFIALAAAWQNLRASSSSFVFVVAIALMLRIPFLFTQPALSDDVWRYFHDGRAQLAGVSPYTHAPNDAATTAFRGPEHSRINHPELRTIYPPAAQGAFALHALLGSSLLVWRLILIACELALLFALLRLGATASNLVLYAWHPLAVIETVGSAHLDPIGIALLLGGLAAAERARPYATGLLFGLSTAFKFVAAPLLLVTRRPAKRVLAGAAVTVLLCYLLYWSSGAVFGSLFTFAASWEANASLYALLAALSDGHRARILAATLLLCVFFVLRASRLNDVDRAAALILAILLLSPVVHPWYLLWALAFLPVIQTRALRSVLFVWSGTLVMSYAEMTTLEYLPVYALLIGTALQHFRARTSDPSTQRTLQTPT